MVCPVCGPQENFRIFWGHYVLPRSCPFRLFFHRGKDLCWGLTKIIIFSPSNDVSVILGWCDESQPEYFFPQCHCSSLHPPPHEILPPHGFHQFNEGLPQRFISVRPYKFLSPRRPPPPGTWPPPPASLLEPRAPASTPLILWSMWATNSSTPAVPWRWWKVSSGGRRVTGQQINQKPNTWTT